MTRVGAMVRGHHHCTLPFSLHPSIQVILHARYTIVMSADHCVPPPSWGELAEPPVRRTNDLRPVVKRQASKAVSATWVYREFISCY
jgi:hypothetical protein